MTDSDDSPKKPSIPSWQKKDPDSTVTPKEEDSSKETRIAQARRFLEDDEVRNTSTAKQISFLESKGYTADEMNELLGVERNADASQPETPPTPEQETPPPPQTSPGTTATPSRPQIIRQEPQAPIITYPEFLVKPTAPSPLITSSRVLTTLTLFSSVYLLLYGSSKYLLTPMQESLTQSRHELLTLASEKLSTLNEKLSDVVSEEPDTGSTYKDQEDEESDGDPTEMFHRDIGIQTSPSLLNASPSRPASPSPNPSASPLESQLERLSVLSSHLQEINMHSISEGTDAEEVTARIDDLREYLEGIRYTTPTYNFSQPAYGGLLSNMAGGATREEPDEIAKLKASIRSVKGVLLSAKSFPTTGRGAGISGIR